MCTPLAKWGLILSSVWVAGCASCENETYARYPSPSGEKVAVAFERSCGATVGFNSQLSIVSASEKDFSETGNAVVLQGRRTIQLEWVSETELAVTLRRGERIYRSEAVVEGVSLKYDVE